MMIAIFFRWIGLLLPAVCLMLPAAHAEATHGNTSNGRRIDSYGDTHALIVGVGQYRHWPMHARAVQDARDVSWALRQLGVSARLLTNPTSQQLRASLSEFARQTGATRDRELIFYYCGNSHTLTASDGRQTGWIIPVDAPQPEEDRNGFERAAVPIDELASLANQIQSRHVLFLFDARLSAAAFHARPPVLKIISSTSALPARQFIAAGRATDAIVDSGHFKYFLLRGLNGEADLIRDNMISGSELGLYLINCIVHRTRQRQNPHFGTLGSGADFKGDFIVRLTGQTPQVARLIVRTKPASATTRILNIKPQFMQGMALAPGRYQLHVSAEGYEPFEKPIVLKAGERRTESVQLIEARSAITNSLGMRFVRVKAGSFLMGSPADEPGRSNDEIRHPVKLARRFFMQRTEVTAGQFKQFVQATGYRTEAEKGGGCWITGEGQGWVQQRGTSWKKPGSLKINDSLPALCITWNDAKAFANWLSRKEQRTYRLPTEAEWEYACRGGKSTPFSTGSCLSTEEANFNRTGPAYKDCSKVFRKPYGRPIKAGQLKPNTWRLHNMHGNVSEWCQDWYGIYPSTRQIDPKGPSTGTERVMRGGHWMADAAGARSAKRRRFPPNLASDAVGFRLVMIP